MIESNASHKTRPSAMDARTPPKLQKSFAFLVGAGLTAAIVAVLLAVDIFPIITNDSLAYIGHSNSMAATGFVQFGYRQVGYPAFLAGVDAIATTARMEPLLLTVLVQRALYLSALAFGAWLWRWRALPLIGLAILPSLLVYSNFILTEGLGVGLALWYAVLVSWIIRLGSHRTGGEIDARAEQTIIVVGVLVGGIYLALATIRFQYVLALFGLLAVLYVMYRSGRSGRTAASILAVTILILGSGFLLFVSQENAREVGPFFPSVRGERSQFWAAWQVTFTLTPENRENKDLIDLFADGNPYAVMGRIDALPSYADQQEAYEQAIYQLVDRSGSSLMNERVKAFVGVLQGGRIDDVRGIVVSSSRTTFATIESMIYRTSIGKEKGVDYANYIASNYNDGRRIQPVVTSPLAPLRTFPYFVSIYRWFLLASALVLLAGIALGATRLLAAVGLLTLISTALVFGFLLMDNVRFMLVPLLFVVATATGVADSGWRYLRAMREHSRGDTAEAT